MEAEELTIPPLILQRINELEEDLDKIKKELLVIRKENTKIKEKLEEHVSPEEEKEEEKKEDVSEEKVEQEPEQAEEPEKAEEPKEEESAEASEEKSEEPSEQGESEPSKEQEELENSEDLKKEKEYPYPGRNKYPKEEGAEDLIMHPEFADFLKEKKKKYPEMDLASVLKAFQEKLDSTAKYEQMSQDELEEIYNHISKLLKKDKKEEEMSENKEVIELSQKLENSEKVIKELSERLEKTEKLLSEPEKVIQKTVELEANDDEEDNVSPDEKMFNLLKAE